MSKLCCKKNTRYLIKCPACGWHDFPVEAEKVKGPVWTFNGNEESPTFNPSVRVRCNMPDMKGHQPKARSRCCHFFIRDGVIEFCGDCTHEYAGKKIPLEAFTETELKLHGDQ